MAKDTLTVQDGVVTSRTGGDKLSYGQLIGEQKLAMKIDPAVPLKDPKDYTIVGTSVPRRDIPAKIFGAFNFVQDHKLPGMLHARVVHPAAVGATLERWNDDACKKIPGYVRAVRKGNFLAVVAIDEWAAIKASTAIVATCPPGPACLKNPGSLTGCAPRKSIASKCCKAPAIPARLQSRAAER